MWCGCPVNVSHSFMSTTRQYQSQHSVFPPYTMRRGRIVIRPFSSAEALINQANWSNESHAIPWAQVGASFAYLAAA
jgi:hypothetical protein